MFVNIYANIAVTDIVFPVYPFAYPVDEPLLIV